MMKDIDKAMTDALAQALSQFEDTPENRLALASLHLASALDLYDKVLGLAGTAEILQSAAEGRRVN